MAAIQAVDASLSVTMAATPNNYGVTHVAWSALPDDVYWNNIKLVRKGTGHPQNIYDGVDVTPTYLITNYNYVFKINTGGVYTGATAIEESSFAEGGTLSTSATTDYVTYTAVAATTTTGSGAGATFDVVRSGKAVGGFGYVISITVNCGGGGYANGDTLTIPKAAIGYTSGTNTPGSNVTDLKLTVQKISSVNAGGIKSTGVTLVSAPSTVTLDHVGLATQAIGASLGSNALMTLQSSGTSLRSGGKGYAAGDYLAVPSTLMTGESFCLIDRAEPNNYGRYGRYHAYDVLGKSTAYNTNPFNSDGTSVVASASAQSKASTRNYYTLFVYYTDNGTSYWKAVGNTSAPVIKDQGTLNVFLSHVPEFYKKGSQSGSRNDLVSFLSLFAFQFDIYKTQAQNVFSLNNTKKTDEILLKLMLKQLGVDFADIPDISQARSLVNKIVKIYKERGSKQGTIDTVNGYSGYTANVIAGRNYMPDYNSASFEETSGLWNPIAATTGTPTTLYYPVGSTPTLVSKGPVVGTITAFNDGAYTAGTGALVTNAVLSSGSANITGTFGTDLKVGSFVSVITGANGALPVGTVVTWISKDRTSFHVNNVVATAGATTATTLHASSNMITGMGVVTGAGATATTATFTLGPQKALTTTTAATGTNTIIVSPPLANADEYVLQGSAIPYETYVVSTSTVASGQSIVLSSTTKSSISASTPIYFSSNASDLVAFRSAWLTVQSNNPYAFSMYFNVGALTNTASVSINWYDRNGAYLSSATAATVTFSSSNNARWYPLKAQGIAPSGALYAEPTFSLTGITNTTSCYVDAAQFEHYVNAISAQVIDANTIEIKTDVEHNFTVQDVVSNTNAATISNAGVPFDGTHNILSVPDKNTVRCAITGGTAGAVVPIAGRIVSNTFYEDARITTVDVKANRVNLITNPSFEIDALTYTMSYSGGASTTSNAIASSGNKTFTVTSTSAMSVGVRVRVVNSAGTSWMEGAVTALASTPSVTIAVDSSSGSGTFTSWTIQPTGTQFWSGSNATIMSTTTASTTLTNAATVSGTYCLKVTPTSSSNSSAVNVHAGTVSITGGTPSISSDSYNFLVTASPTSTDLRYYTLSFYTKSDGTGVPVTATGYFYDDNGSLVSTIVGTTTTNTTSWSRYSNKFTMPVALGQLHAYFTITLGATTSAGGTQFIDDVLLENSSVLNPYFDGSYDGYNYQSDRDSIWETGGVANACRSHYYKNRVSSAGRLNAIITDGLYYA